MNKKMCLAVLLVFAVIPLVAQQQNSSSSAGSSSATKTSTPPQSSTPPAPKQAQPPAASKPTVGGAAPVARKPASQTADLNYVIGPQDILAIDVWQERDLSVKAPVRPDGKITVPLINDIQAAGLTPAELRESIQKALAKYVTDPRVTVMVDQINSRYIYMSGEVNKPGILPLVRSMTVLQALTLVGGPNQFAKANKIYVMRVVNGKTVKFPFDYKKALKEGPGKDNIVLQNGDTVVVP